MNYSLVKVPELLDKSFFEMNKKEAQAYLDWFLSIKEGRLELLDKIVSKSNKEWVLDYKPSSLTPLYTWFKTVVTTRNKTEAEKQIEENKITGLLKGHIDVGNETFTDETVSICSDIGMYFGEVLRKEKDLKWSFVLKPKRYAEYAQPILIKKGVQIDLNPRAIIENVARKILDDTCREDELVKLYNVWKTYF